MNLNCILVFHVSTGDSLLNYAMVMYYQQIYKNVYIFCLYRNRFTVKQLYENYNNVHVIVIDESHNDYYVPEELINKYKNEIGDYKLIIASSKNPDWFKINRAFEFWRKFYILAEIPYEIRYDYKTINRHLNTENNLYQKLIAKYGKEYIFIHDHRHYNYKHYDPRRMVTLNVNEISIPVFHPNYNCYLDYPEHKYYQLWEEEFCVNNLIDYSTIIENASEIHINDSAFCVLCQYLDLSQVKVKCIYTNMNMIDMHNSYNGWIRK